jgi:hypothetical protein
LSAPTVFTSTREREDYQQITGPRWIRRRAARRMVEVAS